jgi:hypothetical protein
MSRATLRDAILRRSQISLLSTEHPHHAGVGVYWNQKTSGAGLLQWLGLQRLMELSSTGTRSVRAHPLPWDSAVLRTRLPKVESW